MKNFVIRLFEWTNNIQIINWQNIDTNKFWGGLLLFICHPIYSIRYERNCYDSFVWRCNNFFTRTMWKYMPLNKYCRWLGHNLVHSTVDNKYIDTFWSSCYKKNVAYRAFCAFGYVHVFAQTKKKKTIYKGWVFTKKKAVRVYNEVITKNKKLYNPDNDRYPEVYDSFFMENTDKMLEILHTGKVKDQNDLWLDNIHLEYIFKNSKDNIEKLWCYVTDLLTMPNDFDAHFNLAQICKECDSYLFWNLGMKKDPTIDYTYKSLLRNKGEKEAKKWQNSQIKQYSKSKCSQNIEKEIEKLRTYYRNKDITYRI